MRAGSQTISVTTVFCYIRFPIYMKAGPFARQPVLPVYHALKDVSHRFCQLIRDRSVRFIIMLEKTGLNRHRHRGLFGSIRVFNFPHSKRAVSHKCFSSGYSPLNCNHMCPGRNFGFGCSCQKTVAFILVIRR